MPYPGQRASKHGHSDILGNPDVEAFLSRCEDAPKPTPDDLAKALQALPKMREYSGTLPQFVLATDGSTYESPVDGRYPSRRIGYVKISSVLLDMERYSSVRRGPGRFIDPMEVARLQRETDTISMALPGAYVIPHGASSVVQGFRREILTYLRSPRTALGDQTLYDTLVVLIGLLGRLRVLQDGREVAVFKICPNSACDKPEKLEIEIPVSDGQANCPHCHELVYLTDAFRIHDAIIESGPNTEALSRLMNVVEHLLGMHYIRYLHRENPTQLSELCLLLDGPLALFGQPAAFHRAIMKFLGNVRSDMLQRGLYEPVVMGLSKTGRLVEHLELIDDIFPPGTVFPVTDKYRYSFVEPAKIESKQNFGNETYYGQDFLIKTEQGHRFVLCVAYPFGDKAGDFRQQKTDPRLYKTLGRAFEVIKHLESDLFGASMIPVVLAHQHASISLMPGGKVLDIMSGRALRSVRVQNTAR